MRNAFCCTARGLVFEVSRPAREAAVPSMNFNRPAPVTPSPPSSAFSHHGHSHGPGTGHHTH